MQAESAKDRPSGQAVDEELLSLLVCPACHEHLDRRGEQLVCRKCGLAYPIRNGIPVMLLSEAVHLEAGKADPAERASQEPGENSDQP
jgi:uncharacterized protein YbaR (Trm112 family)